MPKLALLLLPLPLLAAAYSFTSPGAPAVPGLPACTGSQCTVAKDNPPATDPPGWVVTWMFRSNGKGKEPANPCEKCDP